MDVELGEAAPRFLLLTSFFPATLVFTRPQRERESWRGEEVAGWASEVDLGWI